MLFPFEVPEDLTALSAEEFATFLATVRTFAQATIADDNASSELLVATQALFNQVTAEDTRRTELAASAAAARAELTAGLEPAPVAPEVVPATEPPAVIPPVEAAPAATPVVASGAPISGTIDTPPPAPAERYAIMVGGSDSRGGQLETFGAAVGLISDRLSTYSSSTKENRNAKRGLRENTYMVGGRSMTRHQNVAFRRQYPEALQLKGTGQASDMSVFEYATNERNLPGGSLKAAVEAQVKAGKSLTAAVGWCAPSETIYDLCELESMDGMLDVPEVQAARGGFITPENGGPDFSVIWNGIGDDGDVILTEYEVENGAEKVCVEIPCPDFIETRLDVDYVCITGSLLQSRGYPEAVARFSRGAMVALAHKVNQSVIARMVAGSGGIHTIADVAGSDDAVSQLLSAVELAIEDMKYRHRMQRSTTMEVVLPFWVLAKMRAAMARRQGTATVNITDAEILSWFTTRSAVPRFVYDWQDAYSGLSGGPGGSSALLLFPASVQFLVYPAGTWLKPVRDVVNLDTVYDNALLTQNQFTALFAEDGFNVIKMCVDSRIYQVNVSAAGIVGCCP